MTNNTTEGHQAGKGTTMVANFSSTVRGTLPTGTVTEFGTIEASSLTAYKVAGEWISFDKVHGAPKPVLVPLVVLR